jgi:hypothetical protein
MGSAPPGVEFSDDKSSSIAPLNMGDGILPPERSPIGGGGTTEKHLDKANSLLDEMSREERSGFKAQIEPAALSSNNMRSEDPSPASVLNRGYEKPKDMSKLNSNSN